MSYHRNYSLAIPVSQDNITAFVALYLQLGREYDLAFDERVIDVVNADERGPARMWINLEFGIRDPDLHQEMIDEIEAKFKALYPDAELDW